MKKITILCAFLLANIMLINFIECSDSNESSKAKNENITKKDSTLTKTNENDVKMEGIKAGVTVLGKALDDMAANRRRKDSIRGASAIHTWVYQIGLPFEESDLAGMESDKLNNIPNIYVFKKSKHEYYLIKDDGYSEEQLQDSLGSFKRKVRGIETRVAIIDIGSLCTGKRKPTVSGSIKYKVDGEKKKIECRECE